MGNPSTAVRRSPSSRPKSRPLGAVGLETRLRAQPLAREAKARSAAAVWPGTVGDRAGRDTGPYGRLIGSSRQQGTARRGRRALWRGWRTIPVSGDRPVRTPAPTGRHGGICCTMPAKQPSSSGGKSWRGGQSGSGGLQKGYRRGDAFRIPSALREPPPPRPKLRTKPSHRSIEAAPRLGVLRGERIRAVPPEGG